MKLTRKQLRLFIDNTLISEEKGVLDTDYDYWRTKTFGDAVDDVVGLAKDVAIPDAVARKYNAYRREMFEQAEEEVKERVESMIVDNIESAFESIDVVSLLPPEHKEGMLGEYKLAMAKAADDYLHDMGTDVTAISSEIAECAKKIIARHLRAKLEKEFPPMPDTF